MSNIIVNAGCTIDITDYIETEQAEATSRCLEAHEVDLAEWVGKGTIAGLPCRAYYMTTKGDSRYAADTDDWGGIDWMVRLQRVEIMTDDGCEVARIYNPDYSTEDAVVYGIADTDNGIFETCGALDEAEARLDFWVADGIAKEKANQDDSGLTDSEIEEKVRGFYSIETK
jgi:hypothetical protein